MNVVRQCGEERSIAEGHTPEQAMELWGKNEDTYGLTKYKKWGEQRSEADKNIWKQETKKVEEINEKQREQLMTSIMIIGDMTW